jgi:hypothetical protein
MRVGHSHGGDDGGLGVGVQRRALT